MDLGTFHPLAVLIDDTTVKVDFRVRIVKEGTDFLSKAGRTRIPVCFGRVW